VLDHDQMIKTERQYAMAQEEVGRRISHIKRTFSRTAHSIFPSRYEEMNVFKFSGIPFPVRWTDEIMRFSRTSEGERPDILLPKKLNRECIEHAKHLAGAKW